MKVLMVNKFHYIVGGSETYYFALKKLLEEYGHTVIEFSMHDEKNIKSEYEKYFVSNVDYNSKMSVFNKIKTACSIVYSREAKEKFEKIIIDTQPDIVHLHLFQHQISPSILDVIKKYNIPTVYTAHELKMICPNYRMFNKGKICEECKENKYWKCTKNKCVKDSFAKSLVATVEEYFHMIKKSYDSIDTIITPSNFYRQKFIEFGIDSSRIVHIPNFLDRERPLISDRDDKETYYLYLGRLSDEKGILTLLRAAANTGVSLYIVGKGPMYDSINYIVENERLNNVKITGFLSGQELSNIVGNAKAVVLPSEWYENGPYSAIEALQLKRPIIGARIGGIPELIDGNGFLFESGNCKDLEKAITSMENLHEEEYQLMKANSEKLFEKNYVKQVHYQKLIEIYNELFKEKCV